MQLSRLFVCHSVCVPPHAKIYAWIYMKFLPKVGLFILEVIRTDVHCHLEVTAAQQGHFGVKSTAAQKR